MGLHVAGAPWVVVVAPRTAECLGLFGDKEVGEPGLLSLIAMHRPANPEPMMAMSIESLGHS